MDMAADTGKDGADMAQVILQTALIVLGGGLLVFGVFLTIYVFTWLMGALLDLLSGNRR